VCEFFLRLVARSRHSGVSKRSTNIETSWCGLRPRKTVSVRTRRRRPGGRLASPRRGTSRFDSNEAPRAETEESRHSRSCEERSIVARHRLEADRDRDRRPHQQDLLVTSPFLAKRSTRRTVAEWLRPTIRQSHSIVTGPRSSSVIKAAASLSASRRSATASPSSPGGLAASRWLLALR
jgi:hypothetical protein